MHVSFITYGERSGVEKLLRDMESQKHLMPMTKGKQRGEVWIPGQIRELPFGIKEYVFPKESLDIVLRTLGMPGEGEYGINFKKLAYAALRKLLKLKKTPKFSESGEWFKWNKMFMSIIVLGIREDGEIVGEHKDDLGWTHEAL